MVYTQQDKLVIGAIHKNAANDNNLYLFQHDANGGIDWQVEVDPQSGNLCSVDGLAVDMSGERSCSVFRNEHVYSCGF